MREQAKADFCAYVESITTALASEAQAIGEDFLGHLLNMTSLEAKRIAGGGPPPGRPEPPADPRRSAN